MFENSLSISAVIVDSNGNSHSAVVMPVPQPPIGNTVVFYVFIADTSNSEYTADYVLLQATVSSTNYPIVSSTNYPIIQIPINEYKASNDVLLVGILVEFGAGFLDLQMASDVANSFYGAFVGKRIKWTLYGEVEVYTYSSGGSPVSCTSTISNSSTSQVTFSISYDSTSSPPRLNGTYSVSLSSCQQAVLEQLWIQDSNGNKVYLSIPSSAQSTSIVAYGSKATYTWTVSFTG